MQSQMAAVYRIKDRFLVHPLMRVPVGMWVVWPPFEFVDADSQSLAKAATAALDRSGSLAEAVDTTKAQDTELIMAAGVRSRKQFVESASKCTLRRDEGTVPVLKIRGATRASKGSSWVSDDDAIEVDGSNLTEVAEAIKSLLLR